VKRRACQIVSVCVAIGFTMGPVAACGLSLSGLGPDGEAAVDASRLDSVAPHHDASSADGAIDARTEAGLHDAASEDSALLAEVEAGPVCAAGDGGVAGALALSAFVLVGNATNDENGDGKITLTNSDNFQAGAAWYPTTLPPLSGYDLTWSFRIGPGDTDGDGITFAVLSSAGTPGVGNNGDGLGLQGITGGDGGVSPGYAVALVTYQNTGVPTDIGLVTLELVTMPGFTAVAETAVPTALNDGNVYSVDVSWRAPSSLTATLHGPSGSLYKVASSNAGLTASSATFGFTAATGGISDSHNEIAGITIVDTCD
jgi:hypothetical protein